MESVGEQKRSGLPPSTRFVLRDAVVNLAGLSLPLAAAIAAVPPTIHALGVDRFGLLAFGWVLLGHAGALDLGVGRASTRAAAQALSIGDVDRFSRIAASATLFAASAGVVGAICFGLFAQVAIRYVLRLPQELAGEAESLLLVLGAGLPATLALGAARGVLEAGRRFDYVQFVLVPTNSLLYLLPAAGAAIGLSLPALGLLLVGSKIAALVALLALWQRAFPEVKFRLIIDGRELRGLIRYGGWLTVSGLVGLVVVYGERSVVGAALGVGALAYYVIAYELAGRLWIIPAALSSVLFPLFSSHRGEPEELSVLAGRMVRYLVLALTVPAVALVVWGQPIIELWLGPVTAQGVGPIVALFTVGAVLNSLGYVPLILLQASGRADLTAKVQTLEVIPSLATTSVMSGAFGLHGSAFVWLLRVAADAGILFALAARLNKALLPSVIRFGTLPIATVVAASLALALLNRLIGPEGAAWIGLGMLAVFSVLTWKWLLDSWDRELVLGVVRRDKKKGVSATRSRT